jgi:hypothetical protein
MNCRDCELKYIGQTGRAFRTRYKEQIREIKTNGQKSKYAQHILETTHEYGKIEQIMEILHIERKGRMLNAMESYHIYELTKQNLQMNEALTDSHNQIYHTLIKISQHTKSQPLTHPHTSFAPTQVSYPTEKNTSQQTQPRIKETANSVDLQSPSEKCVVCF